MLICNIPLGISSRAARGRLPTVTHVSLQSTATRSAVLKLRKFSNLWVPVPGWSRRFALPLLVWGSGSLLGVSFALAGMLAWSAWR
jgi:hypothetical protein